MMTKILAFKMCYLRLWNISSYFNTLFHWSPSFSLNDCELDEHKVLFVLKDTPFSIQNDDYNLIALKSIA
jgi:hypothetical protein